MFKNFEIDAYPLLNSCGLGFCFQYVYTGCWTLELNFLIFFMNITYTNNGLRFKS